MLAKMLALNANSSWPPLPTDRGHQHSEGPCSRVLCQRHHQVNSHNLHLCTTLVPSFCQVYHKAPLLLLEISTCLFAAFLAHQGLKLQSISVYLSALRHMQVSADLQPSPRAEWPRLHYVLKGIARSQPGSICHRLPITLNHA